MAFLPPLPDRIGGSLRVRHCSDAKTCKVTRKATGCAWYCFRCPPGENSGWIPDVLPLCARVLHRRSVQLPRGTALGAPAERCDIPESYRGWLAQYGVGAPEILDLGAYWSPTAVRVVFPVPAVRGTGPCLAGRSNESTPKWITDYSACCLQYVPGYGQGPVAVTEDILSAWKMSRAGYQGVPLIGTRCPQTTLAYLLTQDAVILALDPDHYGQKYEAFLERQLRVAGVKTIRPLLPKDPKYLHTSEITCALSET